MIIFLTPLLKFMGATETSLPIAKSYAYTFIISTIFSAINGTAGNLAVSQGATTVFTYSTLYLALGKAVPGMIINHSRQGIFFIPVVLILPTILGLNGVIWIEAYLFH